MYENNLKKLFGYKDSQTEDIKNKIKNMYGTKEEKEYNPFLKSDGTLLNPYINYQQVLDNPNVNNTAKRYIANATGLTPSTTKSSVSKNGVPPSMETVQPASQSSSVVKETGSSIADTAQKYIGTPYVWGGESISEGGMDCSGFVYNALKDAGYKVGRTTAQGYRSYGTKINKADMQAGDLVFFGKDKASHIGIYLGNGKMIHSSGGSKNTKSNPGKGVTITDVNYRSDFLEARRY